MLDVDLEEYLKITVDGKLVVEAFPARKRKEDANNPIIIIQNV